MRSLSSSRVIKSPRIRREIRLVDSPDLAVILRDAKRESSEEKGNLAGPALAEDRADLSPKEKGEPRTGAENLQASAGNVQTRAEDLRARAENFLARAQEEAAVLLEAAREEAERLRREAAEERDGVLAEAAEERDRILAEAEEERDKTREEAYAAGFAEGLRGGREEAAAEYSEKLADAERIRQEAEAESARLRAQAEEERRIRIHESEVEILKLAVEIAEKVITERISETPAAWMKMVQSAVEKVAGAKEVVLRVAPEDEEFIVLQLGTVREILSEAPPVRVVADSSLKKGDFVLQTDLGQVDGRIKEQLKKIAQALQEEAMGQ
jgi:flagellar assembly protein FliH